MKKHLILLFSLLLAGTLMAQEHGRELVILHTNDTHSQVEPFDSKTATNVGGSLRREVLVREERTQHPELLLFDAGDYFQGTPYFNFFKGDVEITLMNAMCYDAAALGNHEFDNGSAALAQRLRKARFPVVCANYKFNNKALSRIVKPGVVIQKCGLKIGVFGLLTDITTLTLQNNLADLQYLDPLPVAAAMVEQFKAEGCDLIICLSHLGIAEEVVNDFQLARAVPDIDIIIGGHSHKELQSPIQVGNTRIYQLEKSGTHVGKIILNF